MYRGKAECNILKKIRHQIATENGIEYVVSECEFQGDCKGTCSKCESELKYLEHQLIQKKKLGKSLLVAGLSAGIISTMLSCQEKPKLVPATPIVTSDSVQVDTIVKVNDTTTKVSFDTLTLVGVSFGGIEDWLEDFPKVDTDVKSKEINFIEDDPSPFLGDTLFINE